MLIKVKVFPNSKKERIEKKSEDSFVFYLAEQAERGEANKKLREVIADYFNIGANKIKIIKGGRSRSKIIKIIEIWEED